MSLLSTRRWLLPLHPCVRPNKNWSLLKRMDINQTEAWKRRYRISKPVTSSIMVHLPDDSADERVRSGHRSASYRTGVLVEQLPDPAAAPRANSSSRVSHHDTTCPPLPPQCVYLMRRSASPHGLAGSFAASYNQPSTISPDLPQASEQASQSLNRSSLARSFGLSVDYFPSSCTRPALPITKYVRSDVYREALMSQGPEEEPTSPPMSPLAAEAPRHERDPGTHPRLLRRRLASIEASHLSVCEYLDRQFAADYQVDALNRQEAPERAKVQEAIISRLQDIARYRSSHAAADGFDAVDSMIPVANRYSLYAPPPTNK